MYIMSEFSTNVVPVIAETMEGRCDDRPGNLVDLTLGTWNIRGLKPKISKTLEIYQKRTSVYVVSKTPNTTSSVL